MDGEPGGYGRNPKGSERAPLWDPRRRSPPDRDEGQRPVLTGGSGLSPRCRFPRPERGRTGGEPWPRHDIRRAGPRSCARVRGCASSMRQPAGRPRRPRNARTPSRTAFPQFGRASMAVAEGFEPSVSLPTLAFEASSFGRSDTLPRESLDHGGPWTEIGSQGVRKKDVRTLAHSCSRTPWMTSGRWLRRRSRTRSQREPAAPAFSSRAP